MKTMTRTQAPALATASTLIAMWFLAMITGLADAQQKTPIYKSIAEDGSTVFTDQPAPNATVIRPSPLNVMDSPAAKPAGAGTTVPAAPVPALEAPSATTIDSIVIKHPLDEQTFIDPKEQILVEISTSPASALPTGVSANLRLDDVLVATGTSYQMPLDVPERGSHRLQIQLVDQSGRIIVESEIIQIHVKRRVASNAN